MTTPSFDRTTLPGLPEEERRRILADPGFGSFFTDHMVSIEWTADGGWHNASVLPYGPLQLDPAAAVFHYGQEVFEGLKGACPY